MLQKLHLTTILITAVTLAHLTGCSKLEEQKNPAPKMQSSRDTIARKQTEVAVPAIVKGKWKAVKLSIVDKEKGKEGTVVIEIGKTMKIDGTNLVIQVETFLPHFIMEGTTLTSSTNTPKNPAVMVHITENDKEVFKGWLFTLYPNTHATQHAKYGFGLVDFYPAD